MDLTRGILLHKCEKLHFHYLVDFQPVVVPNYLVAFFYMLLIVWQRVACSKGGHELGVPSCCGRVSSTGLKGR